MSKLGELGQDLSRISEIAQVMAKHGFAPKLTRMPFSLRKSQANKEHAQVPSAERFASMLEELGPTFVKIGQLLSTRGDLLPPDFIQALSRLQDNVPPVTFEAIKQQIESSLKKPLDKLFAKFDPIPLASASIAQVHTAELHNGTNVVVKVLRPGIEQQIERDSSVLLMIAQLLEWLVEEASAYQAVDLAEEFARALASELDFRVEATNLQTFKAHNQHRAMIRVPNFYPELSSAQVLTMERIYGRRISELKNEPDVVKTHHIVEALVEAGFEHVFVDGLFHADPHPGNVLVTDDGKIAFIDFGLLGRVARDHQDRLLSILLALSLKDPDTLSRQLIHLGEPTGRVHIHRFRNSIRRMLDRYSGLSISSIPAGSVMGEMLEISLKYKIHLPKEFALLTRASIAIEGIVRLLHPQLDVSKKLAKQAEELLLERLDPRNFRAAGMKTALQLATLAQDLPAQINQTLVDLERGQISIQSKELGQLDRTMRGMAMAVFSGLVAAAFIMGGFFWLAKADSTNANHATLAWLSFGFAFALFCTVLGWSLTGGRLPKVPIGWLAKRGKKIKPKGD
jgi:ubiquinone biosynthesis protein